jgi:hypothetical protein
MKGSDQIDVKISFKDGESVNPLGRFRGAA